MNTDDKGTAATVIATTNEGPDPLPAATRGQTLACDRCGSANHGWFPNCAEEAPWVRALGMRVDIEAEEALLLHGIGPVESVNYLR